MTDKTSRFRCKGQDIKHFVSSSSPSSTIPTCWAPSFPTHLGELGLHAQSPANATQMGTSTFSQYTVISKFSVVAIDPDAPLQKHASSAAVSRPVTAL
jgi:hypothetical protein